MNDVIELIGHASGIPYIRTGTNGFLFRMDDSKDEKQRYRIEKTIERLAAAKLRKFWISIDSVNPEVHEQMRVLKTS